MKVEQPKVITTDSVIQKRTYTEAITKDEA